MSTDSSYCRPLWVRSRSGSSVAGRRASRARPSSAPSQHFLRTSALAAQIVRDACVGADDVVVDIGAGSGRLTGELARAARRVVAVELDPLWASRLRGRWTNVDVIEGDAGALQLPTEPFRVVANLPFGRTTDLLHLLLDDRATPLIQADVIVEWAVAVRRGLPWPSTVNGVIWGAQYESSISRRLPRAAFDPVPNTDAGVVVFRRRREPLIPADLARPYGTFVAGGFRHGLRSVASSSAIGRVAGGRPIARDLDAHQWAELFLNRRR